MELPGGFDVPERFVEAACDVVVAVHVEARAREPACAGLTLERAHDRPAPSLTAALFVHRDVVDPRHRRVIGRGAEPQHADALAVVRGHRDEQDLSRGRQAVREERIVGSTRGNLRRLAGRLAVTFELTRIVIDRPVEVRVELVGEQGAKANRSGRSSLLPRERCDDGRPYDAELDAESAQHLSRHAFALTDETQQEMPGADVLVAELTGFEERELEDLLRARRERDVSGRWGPSASDDLLDL